MKKVILSTVLITMLNISLPMLAYGINPNINYTSSLDRAFWDRQYSSKEAVYLVKKSSATFFRRLGKDKKEVFRFMENGVINKEKSINNNYDGIYSRSIWLWFYGMMPRGLYIYPKKSNNSIGYLLLDFITLNKVPIGTDPVLVSIKSLNTNQSYLSGLTFPSSSIVTNYEKIHDGFIERYIIAKVNNLEVLVAEMFYPLELDSKLTPYTYDFIQRTTRKMELHNKIENKTITKQEEDEYLDIDQSAFE